MFASRQTKDITIKDGEQDVTVTIQKLSGNSLEKARVARAIAQATPMRAFGSDLIKALRSDELEKVATDLAQKKEAPASRKKARNDLYDRGAVLLAGIRRWSCDVILSQQAIEDLEEGVAMMIYEEILDYSLPPLDADEAAAIPKGA